MSSRSVPVTILNGAHHMAHHSRHHARRAARHNPDGMHAAKAVGAAVVSGVALAVIARYAAGMKNPPAQGAAADSGAAKYTPKAIYLTVAAIGTVGGLALAAMKNPFAQIAGTGMLGATAGLVGPSLYQLYTTPATPAGQTPAPMGNPLLGGRTAGLFGITGSEVRRGSYAY